VLAVAQASRSDRRAQRAAALRRLATTYRAKALREVGPTEHALLATARELEAEARRIDSTLSDAD